MRLGGTFSPWRVGIICGLLAGCSANEKECAVSTDTDYDYQVTASDDVIIRWTTDTQSEEITLEVTYGGTGWVGIGFSVDGSMVGSDAVIGLPDEDTVSEYNMTAKSLSSVTVFTTTKEISGESITQSDGETTLVFTRPLSPADSSKLALSTEEGEEAIFIWGTGSDNVLDIHSDRGDVVLEDIFCSGLTAADEEEEAGTAGCSSSDPDYAFEVSPSSDLSFFWSVVEDDTAVSVKAVYDGEGWLGIGFSDSGKMSGSDAVVGLPDEDTVLEYDMDSYSTPEESPDSEITNATITQSDGVTTLTFVRPLEPSGDGKQVLSLGEETSWLYAWGSGNTFSHHTAEGSFDLDLSSCDIKATEVEALNKEIIHAWLMVLSWGVCFPMGIMFARFSRDFTKFGFPMHRALQSVGAVIALAGFFVAVWFTSDLDKDHFNHSHGLSGLILMVFIPLQVGVASCRPAKKPREAMMLQPGMAPARDSNARRVWQFLHITLGYIAAVWGLLQVLGGFHWLDGVSGNWRIAYLVLVLCVILSFGTLQARAFCCRANDHGRPEAAEARAQAQAGTFVGDQ